MKSAHRKIGKVRKQEQVILVPFFLNGNNNFKEKLF